MRIEEEDLCCSSDEAGRGLGKAEGGSNLETKMRKGQEAGRGSGRLTGAAVPRPCLHPQAQAR